MGHKNLLAMQIRVRANDTGWRETPSTTGNHQLHFERFVNLNLISR
jgi:hypothetical protein